MNKRQNVKNCYPHAQSLLVMEQEATQTLLCASTCTLHISNIITIHIRQELLEPVLRENIMLTKQFISQLSTDHYIAFLNHTMCCNI
jgi:hypothetical protein